MQSDAGERELRAADAREQAVETGVRCGHRPEGREREPGAAGDRGRRRDDGRGRGDAMAAREVQRARAGAALELKRNPRRTARYEVRAQHRAQRPALEVGAARGGLELDPPACGVQAHPEIDVLDRRRGVARDVEAADRAEGLPTNRTEPGPERRGGAGRADVDVVVQQVAKPRDGRRRPRPLVVRAEDGIESEIALECVAQAPQRIRMHLDVGIHEHDDGARAGGHAGVARSGGAAAGRSRHDDDLVRLVGARQRRKAALQGGWSVRRGNHDRNH